MKFVVALCMFILAAAPATAGWKGLQWEMSPAEARGVFELSHQPASDAVKRAYLGRAQFSFDYALSGMTFDGALLFDDDKLYAVSLKLRETDRCERLEKALRMTHKTPAVDAKAGNPKAGWHVSWNVPNLSNTVTLRYTPPDQCVLSYRPYPLPDE